MDLLIMLFAALLSGDVMALNYGIPDYIVGISVILKMVGVVVLVLLRKKL